IRLLRERDLALSAQVLQEFFVQATRPSRTYALPRPDAASLVQSFLRFPVQPITSEVVLAAVSMCDRYGISYWDAAIVEAARAIGCDVVLSEDLGNGTDFDGVRVEDPFKGVAA